MNAQDMPTDAGESKTRKRKSTRNPDHYYQRNAQDFLDGTRDLSLAARGAYSDLIDLMYVGNGSLKNCDFWIACTLHVKQKQWKAIRPQLFADPSKLFIGDDGRIHNPRVDEEFSKRAAQRLAKPSRASRRSLADVSGDSAGNVNEGKDNDLNGGGAENHEPPTRELASKQVEAESEGENRTHQPASLEHAGGALAGLNGSAAPMLRDIVAWMNGGDEPAARSWLATQTALYGDRAVRDSYAKLKTDLACSGSRSIAKPLQTWCRIAQRMRDAPSTPDAARHTSPKIERAKAFLREAGLQ